MLNYVWSFLLLVGLVAGALFGRLEGMVTSVFDVCKTVVLDIALPLAGLMMLWLGILRVMEKSGLMEVVAWVLSPVLRRLFPEVPTDHPAMGAMTMNIAANMLGLGNSATPLGLKAMTHLQELNPNKQSASNAMCMFLALNTAGFSLIPMTAINYLNAGGVKNPQAIIAPTIIATLLASIMGVLAAKFLQRLPVFRALPDEEQRAEGQGSAPVAFRLSLTRRVLLVLAAAGFLFGVMLQFSPEARKQVLAATGMTAMLDAASERKHVAEQRKVELKKTAPVETSAAEQESGVRKVLLNLSVIAIPAIFMITALWGLARGVPVYEEMVEGAKEGFGVATRIMPFLVVMLTAMVIFRESGALLLLEFALRP
ncbi:MAG: nucleoside recognition domain-containing protein, partial [Roseimicrobium sp.]